jgi:hypothetical protein
MLTEFEKLRQFTPEEFAAFGRQGVAYIKRVVVNGTVAFAIHAADGAQLALVPSEDIAIGTLKQHDLEPHSVH